MGDARAVALELLAGVLDRHRSLDELIEASAPLAALEPRDRGFARMLAATALRRLPSADRGLSAFLDKPIAKLPDDVRHVLRLGWVQLKVLGVPAHAAVGTAVGLVRARRPSHAGLVNAVLRRVAGAPDVEADPLDDLPEWLARSWVDAYGVAEARRIALASLSEAPLDLSARGDPRELAAPLDAMLLPWGTLRRASGGPVTGLPFYGQGLWWVQDAAAALPARLLGDVGGRDIIDLCAAPGGKTAQLAAAGARVTAVDRSGTRLQRLAANLERLRLTATLVEADATAWRPTGPADAVLLDAPCTATGTIRRHPDIVRLKHPDELATLAELQAKLLAQAVRMLRTGGTLVYCTCSLQPEEGERQIERLLGQTRSVRVEPIRPAELPGLEAAVTPRGEMRVLPSMLPGLGGLDGFYAARLVRL